MADHTWRHRLVNVENKKRAQEGKEPFPKYKGQGWDQKSQDDGSWQPSDVDYGQVEKDLGKEGKLTWPKPKIHPDDVAPEDKYKKSSLQINKGTVDYSKTAKEKEFDKAVDSVSPEGKYQRPPLENLRRGVRIKNMNRDALAIAGFVGATINQLLIRPILEGGFNP